MARRAVPALLVAAAAVADAAGAPGLALYALLAAVPALAFAGLVGFGELLDGDSGPNRQLQTLLRALAIALVITGAAVRAPAVGDGDLPPLAGTALFACLVVLALEAFAGAAGAAVERPPRRRPVSAEDTAEELREAA